MLVMKAGWNPLAAMVGAAFIGVLGGLLIGFPAFRLRGPYFALSILGFAEVIKLLTLNLTGLTEGSQGLFNIPSLPTVRWGGLTLDFYISRTTNYYLGFFWRWSLSKPPKGGWGSRSGKKRIPKSEIRSTKSETSTKVQNPNDQNKERISP